MPSGVSPASSAWHIIGVGWTNAMVATIMKITMITRVRMLSCVIPASSAWHGIGVGWTDALAGGCLCNGK